MTLAELVAERNALANSNPAMMNLASTTTAAAANNVEEGHVFDHEPGMADYHHDHRDSPEYTHHDEYYAQASYPVYHQQNLEYRGDHYAPAHHSSERRHHEEANMYRSLPLYSPIVPHDWELKHKEKRKHTFDDYDLY